MLKKSDIIAIDASSVRSFDNNGNLHVSTSPLTRVQVAPYYGFEIPGWDSLGLDPKKLYYGYRCAEELSKPETIKSVEGIPIQLDHHPDYPQAPAKDTRVGSTGDKAKFEEPYLYCSLHIQDQKAIDHIKDGSMRELSLGYSYEPDFSPGETESGQKYDFIMRDIRANHLALVENGRGGPSVLVLDHSLDTTKIHKIQGDNAMRSMHKKPLAMDGELETEKKEVELADKIKQDAQALSDLHETNGQGEIIDKSENVADDEPNPIVKILLEAGIDPEKAGSIASRIKNLASDEEPNSNVPTDDAEPDKNVVGDEDKTTAEDEEPDNKVADGLKSCGLDDADEKTQQAFAEGVKYGESLIRNPDERKKLDSEHESEGEKKALGEDSAKFIAKAIESKLNAKFKALDECSKSLGRVRWSAYDSAGDVYLDALRAEGVSTKGLSAKTARAVYLGFMQGKRKNTQIIAQDSALKKDSSAITSILNRVNKGY